MKILLVCTANSCRSQMAESWARKLFPRKWEVHSAGLITSPISSKTKEAMKAKGLHMRSQRSKSIDDYNLNDFDHVLTFSKQAANFLPTLKHPERHIHFPVTDPTGSTGTPAQVKKAYAEARDLIGDILKKFVEDHS
jgi:arsenate reductase (thioredoxin)